MSIDQFEADEESELENSNQELCSSMESENPEETCSGKEALDALKKLSTWCESRWDFKAQDLLYLEKIRETTLQILYGWILFYLHIIR